MRILDVPRPPWGRANVTAREERPLELVPRAALRGKLPTVSRMDPSKPAKVGKPEASSAEVATCPQREPPPQPLGAHHKEVGGSVASPKREPPDGERATVTSGTAGCTLGPRERVLRLQQQPLVRASRVRSTQMRTSSTAGGAARGRGKAVAAAANAAWWGLRAQHAPCAVVLARSAPWRLQLASPARSLGRRGNRRAARAWHVTGSRGIVAELFPGLRNGR
eukprot:1528731-Alexandrium_andersonii.AAC.1